MTWCTKLDGAGRQRWSDRFTLTTHNLHFMPQKLFGRRFRFTNQPTTVCFDIRHEHKKQHYCSKYINAMTMNRFQRSSVPRLYSLDKERTKYPPQSATQHDIPSPSSTVDFCRCPTPKINNCGLSNKRRRRLMMMLDGDSSLWSCPEDPSASDTSSSTSNTTKTEEPSAKSSTSSSQLTSQACTNKREGRRTQTFSPLDYAHWLVNDDRQEDDQVDDELLSQQPPGPPERRNGLCPTNMPVVLMIQMVIGY